jgi:hypothetical protein
MIIKDPKEGLSYVVGPPWEEFVCTTVARTLYYTGIAIFVKRSNVFYRRTQGV